MLIEGSGGKGASESVSSESLTVRGKRLREVMKRSNAGPYEVANEVHAINSSWDQYKDEAGGLTCSGWLKSVFGGARGASYWETRFDAVMILGEAIRRTIDQEVAVWLVNLKLQPGDREKARNALMVACRQNASGMPLNYSEARRVCEPLIGYAYPHRICPGCVAMRVEIDKLRAAMKAAGIGATEE
jgi:hypothetical protein